MRKKRTCVLAALLAVFLGLTCFGCGFSVGVKTEGQKELFPDRQKSGTGVHASSHLGYDYRLSDDYGHMMIYVDTSEGHRLEVTNNPTGFQILDRDGQVALYAVCMESEAYETFASLCTEKKTINGREFFYRYNDGDGSMDVCTSLTDLGVTCGLIMEVHDGAYDNFSLVAFRKN